MVTRKVGLAVFRDGQIIMARNRKHEHTFANLGGKVEAGETDEQCAAREVMEEAATTIAPGSLEFLHEFHGLIKDDPERPIVLRLYRCELAGEPVPSSEIAEFRYFDSSADPALHTSITNKTIYPWLKAQGLIR
jgi:8-oxo-dGTP diphosphatase